MPRAVSLRGCIEVISKLQINIRGKAQADDKARGIFNDMSAGA
jgi:hypothetical protein